MANNKFDIWLEDLEDVNVVLPQLKLSGNDLGELLDTFYQSVDSNGEPFNPYHHIVTEWDYENMGPLGMPELVASTRVEMIEGRPKDLSDFIE